MIPRPDQIVVDLPLSDLAPLGVDVVKATDGCKRRVVGARLEHNGKIRLNLGVVVWLEDARIPARSGIELVDQIRREQMGVANSQCVLRLRRVGIEDGVDRIGIGGLQARVPLEAIPYAVVGVDGVIDLDDDEIFRVAVGK